MKITTGSVVEQPGVYRCTRCGKDFTFKKGDVVPKCDRCYNKEFEFIRAE